MEITTQTCAACQAPCPPENRYCGQCGALLGNASPLSEQIRTLLKAEFKDQKVVEIETTQLIVGRISEWAKLFGFFTAIPVAILLGGLAIWGVSKFADVNDKLSKAQERAEALQKTSQQVEDRYTNIQKDVARFESLGSQVDAVIAKSDSLNKTVNDLKSDVSQISKHIGFIPSSALTPSLQKTLQSSLADFEGYLRRMGFSPSGGTTQVEVVDKLDGTAVAQFFPSENKLVLTSQYASSNPANMLQEYMHVVLKERNQSWGEDMAYHAVRIGLSCYLPSAFLQSRDSCIGENLSWPASIPPNDTNRINGAGRAMACALWQIRAVMNQRAVDSAAFKAWTDTQNSYQDPHYERIYAQKLLDLLEKNKEAERVFRETKILP